MDKWKLLPRMVARPSGVWDSRAPFNDFLLSYRQQSRSYYAASLALYEIRRRGSRLFEPSKYSPSFFRARDKEAIASGAWLSYTKAFGCVPGGTRHKPTSQEILEDIEVAIWELREAAIVRNVALFETFSQCWALNMLLAKIENGRTWAASEAKLAFAFHPVFGNRDIPGWPRIVQSIVDLQSGLEALPHIKTDPSTGKDVTQPISPELNAFQIIRFWRSFRNLSVHRSNFVSTSFAREHGAFFEKLMAFAPHVLRLEEGKPLLFYESTYLSTVTVHYKAALWMNEWLKSESSLRRGHPEAPGPKTKEVFEAAMKSPPLLKAGDHQQSCQWATDPSFRGQMHRALSRESSSAPDRYPTG
jgi:hypothetical protein